MTPPRWCWTRSPSGRQSSPRHGALAAAGGSPTPVVDPKDARLTAPTVARTSPWPIRPLAFANAAPRQVAREEPVTRAMAPTRRRTGSQTHALGGGASLSASQLLLHAVRYAPRAGRYVAAGGVSAPLQYRCTHRCLCA